LALPLFKRSKTEENPQAEMGFIDHLEILRWHLVRSAIAVVLVAIVIFINIDWFFDTIILGPLRSDFWTYDTLCRWGQYLHLGKALCMPYPQINMQVTAFGSQFMSSITIAILGGFIIAFPYVFYEFWRFIKPALSDKEVKRTRGAIFWVTFFFLLGLSFGYFLLAPFTFSFLSNFKLGVLKAIETKPTLDDYLDNMINILIGTGLSFELPVISYVLTKIGIVGPNFLRNYRRYAIVIILIVAAIITPSPDWISQAIVAIPLYSLYELGILISVRVERENNRELNQR
jgi:sec-independent protein translocase protein TatC